MALPPPRLWQQFEELTADVAKLVFNDSAGKGYGNPGAPQNGVDVYARKGGTGPLVGIQCKRLGRTDNQGRALSGGLKIQHLAAEISKAKTFTPSLGHFILATTDSRQVAIQKEEIRLCGELIGLGLFKFEVWFWEDYLAFLHRYPTLLQWYYSEVLKLNGVYNIDHQILYLIHMAFSRPAFTTPLSQEESGLGLFEALKDTETALNTGQLRDRESSSLMRAAPGGISLLSNSYWQSELRQVLRLIREARKCYKDAKDNEQIVEKQHGISAHPDVALELDRIRQDATQLLNQVLKQADLPEVESF